MLRIDPHAHTLHSDGTDTPTELIEQAELAGLDLVGLADHDTTEGWEEAKRAALARGAGLILGAEISTLAYGYPVHILGLLFDGEDEDLQNMFARARESRKTRLKAIFDNLRADFPLVEWESVVARADGAPLGRPHLADELVEKGYFTERDQTFESVLHPHGPYYARQKSTTATEAVEAINAAGGVAIFAHPRAIKRGRPIPLKVFGELAEAGIYGLEVHHRDHSEAAVKELTELAAKYDLPITGGSDYHGTGKPNRLGENLTSPEVFADIANRTVTPVIYPNK